MMKLEIPQISLTATPHPQFSSRDTSSWPPHVLPVLRFHKKRLLPFVNDKIISSNRKSLKEIHFCPRMTNNILGSMPTAFLLLN